MSAQNVIAGFSKTEFLGEVTAIENREKFMRVSLTIRDLFRGQECVEHEIVIIPNDIPVLGGKIAPETILFVEGKLKTVMRNMPRINPDDVVAQFPAKELLATAVRVVGVNFKDCPF